MALLLPPELSDIAAAFNARPDVPIDDVTAGVWSLAYPETRAAAGELWAAAPHLLFEQAWNGGQGAIPTIFLDAWKRWSGVKLGDAFPWAYVGAGASEGIKELIQPGQRVNVFAGEYQGFAEIAKARGCEVRVHPHPNTIDAEHVDALRAEFTAADVFWISEPQSVDGEHNPIIDMWIDAMLVRHPDVRIFIDMSFVGTMKLPIQHDLAKFPNVAAVVFSLSKPFGIYYHRIGGVFSRTAVPSMYGNRWFFNAFSATLGVLLMRRHAVSEIPLRYVGLQEQVLRDGIERGIAPRSAVASNAVLLARSFEGPDAFRRCDNHYRYCLSPGMYRAFYPEETR